jgi:hypothetical protein
MTRLSIPIAEGALIPVPLLHLHQKALGGVTTQLVLDNWLFTMRPLRSGGRILGVVGN